MENKGTNGKVQRGEIYLYDFGNNGGSIQNGVRPALVVQCDEGNAASSTTIIAAMTSIIKKQYLPSHIILGDRFGLKEPSMVMLEQLKTVNQSDLIEYIGKIDDEHYIYEDQVLGNISAERYARMSVNYENEQRTLINKVAEDEKKLACIEQTSLDLKTLLKVLRSSTSFDELTPTLVNSLIRRIEVHNNDKSSGHCYVKVDIYFTAIGLIDIPTEDEIKSLMAKIKANPQEYRLTA
ncbi:MAG: type II toxin-antitoxin system PemK/MazF family toxin [Dysosmobacter sp.]